MRKYRMKVSPKFVGQRLDHVISAWLSEESGQNVSRALARKLIMAGAVYLNRKRVRIASKTLINGAEIEVYFDEKKVNASGAGFKIKEFELTAEHILFEDEDIIVLNKPAGLPTHPTLDEARVNLYSSVQKYLQKKTGQIEVYVGLHHRLDRDTSGVILMTKSKKANPSLADQFKEHQMTKVYQALSVLPLKITYKVGEPWTVKSFVAKDRAKNRGGKGAARWRSVRSGGDLAITHFKILSLHAHALLIEASPQTGRTHQIRVHLSEQGMPILGDQHYGFKNQAFDFEIPRVMLHASALTFKHPIHHNQMTVLSPVPEDFQKCLNQLK